MGTEIMTNIHVSGWGKVCDLSPTECYLCENFNFWAHSESIFFKDHWSGEIKSFKESNSTLISSGFEILENPSKVITNLFLGNLGNGNFEIIFNTPSKVTLWDEANKTETHNYSDRFSLILKNVTRHDLVADHFMKTGNLDQGDFPNQVLSSSDWNRSLVVDAITLVALGALGIVLARACFRGSVKDSQVKKNINGEL